MEAKLASLNEFEVLHRIGDINFRAIDLEFSHDLVKDSSCWADEGLALKIFLVTRLFAHEDKLCMCCSRSRNNLRGVLVELASLAFGQCFAKR